MKKRIFGGVVLLFFSFAILLSAEEKTRNKSEFLTEIGWNKLSSTVEPKTHFAADVDERRKRDLRQVLSTMHKIFGGGFECHFFVTGGNDRFNKPVLEAAEAIIGHTPQQGSYYSSVGTDPTDGRKPTRVIFIEKESVPDHEHQLAVLVHEYYHAYQNSFLAGGNESRPPAWFIEGAAKLMETIYTRYQPNDYTHKQETLEKLLAYYKRYSDENEFEFGSAQAVYEGVNPAGTVNYNMAAVAVAYLSHLTSYRQVLTFEIYQKVYDLGWSKAFLQTFGMSESGFYKSLNQFMTTRSTAEIMAVLPPTSDLLVLLGSPQQDRKNPVSMETVREPQFFVAEGLDADGSLVKNYKRGLQYAIDYFGNYGPYNIYLLGPGNEENIRSIFRKRAANRAASNGSISIEKQIEDYLIKPNIEAEINAVLEGKAEGGLTWSGPPQIVYEDVTTNAKGRILDPKENTWGALHEYHHVFQVAHSHSFEERTSDSNLNSWMLEGIATYSSAKFMENLGLLDFKSYMLELKKNGANIGRPGINDFLSGRSYRLDDESYWKEGSSAPVYYMLGAWATAYLIHVLEIDEVTVLKSWYHDVLRIGKKAAFEKHMNITLKEFYPMFETFIRQSDEEVMKIFESKQ